SGRYSRRLATEEHQLAASLRQKLAMDYRRHDSIFHQTIAVVTGKPHLYRAIEAARARYLKLIGDPNRYVRSSKSVVDHLLIYEAIREADSARAGDHMQKHIEHTREMLRPLRRK